MCNAFRNRQQGETLHPHDIPGLPWQVVGNDLFEYGGQTYLLVADFYSKFFEIELLRKNTAICVSTTSRKYLRGLESQRKLSATTDRSTATPEICSATTMSKKKFAEDWGFSHTTSSPEYSQSSGAAERAVQTARRILERAAAETHLRDC